MGLQQDVGDVSVEDIRLERVGSSIRDEIYRQLQPGSGNEKRMPTMLLYDEKGLKLFEDLTYLEEYYLTNAEIRVLEHHAAQIAERIVPDSILLELGSGNLRKVSILLQAIERAEKDVHYYALDLSLSELQRTLSVTPHGKYKHIHCHGLLGTYDDGLEWLKQPRNLSKPKCVLSLGSSIGNFDRLEAAQFLKKFADILDVRNIVLVGVDACQTPDKVYRAYNDSEGKTHEFYRNGLRHANRLLAKEAFTPEDWNILGEYDAVAGRHQAFYVARRELEIAEINFAAGEKVRFEESYKYSKAQSDRLWHNAGLAQGAVFGEDSGDYCMFVPMDFCFS